MTDQQERQTKALESIATSLHQFNGREAANESMWQYWYERFVQLKKDHDKLLMENTEISDKADAERRAANDAVAKMEHQRDAALAELRQAREERDRVNRLNCELRTEVADRRDISLAAMENRELRMEAGNLKAANRLLNTENTDLRDQLLQATEQMRFLEKACEKAEMGVTDLEAKNAKLRAESKKGERVDRENIAKLEAENVRVRSAIGDVLVAVAKASEARLGTPRGMDLAETVYTEIVKAWDKLGEAVK